MERTYESAAALVGRAAGPLASHLSVCHIVDRPAVRSERHLHQGTARTGIRPLAREAPCGVGRFRRSADRAVSAPQSASTPTYCTETRRREWYEVTRWYESGEDPARRLPVLSTYLGHVYVAGTYWYLSNWPELMARLEQRWGESS